MLWWSTVGDWTMASLLLDNIPNDMLSLVGKINVRWTQVDFLLGELVGGLKGLDVKTRSEQIHKLDTKDKITQAASKVEAKIKDQKEKDSIIKLISQAKDLATDRNYVIHGLIHQKAPVEKSTFYIKIFRGKYLDQQKAPLQGNT
jgi:hypothetical protein